MFLYVSSLLALPEQLAEDPGGHHHGNNQEQRNEEWPGHAIRAAQLKNCWKAYSDARVMSHTTITRA